VFEDVGPLIQRYGYGVVGGVVCLEAMGLPFPGESLIIASAIYAATTGELHIQFLVLSAAIGAIMGDNFGYAIGHRLGRPALERYGPKVGLTVPRQKLGQYLFFKYGGSMVFIGRFIAFVRTFAALLAGANGMNWWRFLMWNALGGIAWTSLYGFGAYALGTQAQKLAGPIGWALAGAAVLAAAGVFWFLKRNEARLVRRAEAEMSAYEESVAAKRAARKQRAG
jgi:membrane protein DedA with SNARE-associated domain